VVNHAVPSPPVPNGATLSQRPLAHPLRTGTFLMYHWLVDD
jgi:hypothetical protein